MADYKFGSGVLSVGTERATTSVTVAFEELGRRKPELPEFRPRALTGMSTLDAAAMKALQAMAKSAIDTSAAKLSAEIERLCEEAYTKGPDVCVAISEPEFDQDLAATYRVKFIHEEVASQWRNDGWAVYGPWPA